MTWSSATDLLSPAASLAYITALNMFPSVQNGASQLICHIQVQVHVRHTWCLDAVLTGVDGSHSIIGKLYMIG